MIKAENPADYFRCSSFWEILQSDQQPLNGATNPLSKNPLELIAAGHTFPPVGPDLFPLGVRQPCHGEAEAGEQLLLATDTLLPGFRGVHIWKDTCFSLRTGCMFVTILRWVLTLCAREATMELSVVLSP